MSENVGRTLGGRYEICERIGAGGAGTVYRARDLLLDRVVAVKLLRPGQDVTARARLRAEARIAARLSHPSIAAVLDYGEDVVDGEPWPYLVMEYVEGVTLRDVLRRGPLPPARVAALVAQVAEALAAAHAAGVVHRDVKPGNVMLTGGAGAVLLDFGIARHADHEPLTLTGNIVGTVDYISPEQAAGRSATARSDLFALGMVAHEALTGRRALARETQMATLLAHATEDVGPLPNDIPAPLRALVEHLLQRNPSERPADAASVVRRARGAVSTEPPARAPVPATAVRSAAGSGHRRRRDRRHHGLLLAVGVAALVLAALGTVLTRGASDTPRATVAREAAAGHRAAGVSVLTTRRQASASVAAAAAPAGPAVTQVAAVATQPGRAHAAPAAHHRGKIVLAAAHGKTHRHGHGAGGNGHGRGHHKRH